ncbi:hypothetical protein BD289DRAFT_443190 [Coniella lustricola]|uniref:Secreted protein n=1 Tax=Coniella lustricola TaxID=2025994 RepID=A0A2T2ZXG7_9PEZI|nr:hypothetical protein BD289DRAFT_443190 [Coniella lustricola]
MAWHGVAWRGGPLARFCGVSGFPVSWAYVPGIRKVLCTVLCCTACEAKVYLLPCQGPADRDATKNSKTRQR